MEAYFTFLTKKRRMGERKNKVNFEERKRNLNDELHRVSWPTKHDRWHKRLVQWNSCVCNAMVHAIQNKREFTLCCVHHNAYTVSCVDAFSAFFPWAIHYAWVPVVVRRPRAQF